MKPFIPPMIGIATALICGAIMIYSQTMQFDGQQPSGTKLVEGKIYSDDSKSVCIQLSPSGELLIQKGCMVAGRKIKTVVVYDRNSQR